MHHLPSWILLLPFCIGASFLQAEPLVVDMENAVRYASGHNLQLRAAQIQIEAARARLKWSGKLDNPELEVAGATDQFGLNEGESTFQVAFAQRFPVTNRLRREKELSQADLALAESEVNQEQWRLAGEVRTAVAEELSLKERARLRDRFIESYESLVKTLRGAVERGEASQLDLSAVELEAQTRSQELKAIDAERAKIQGELKTLLGVPPATPLVVSNGILLRPVPLVNMDEHLLAVHPQIQASVLKESRARAVVALAASQRWQDVAVKLFLEKEAAEDAPDGLERNTFAGIGVSVPLPLRTSKRRMTEAHLRELEAARATTEAESIRIRNEVAAAQKELEVRHETAQHAGGEVLQLARRQVEETTQAWKAGQTDFIRLQRAQEQALRLEESAIEALHSYQLARIRLQQAAGGTFTHPKP